MPATEGSRVCTPSCEEMVEMLVHTPWPKQLFGQDTAEIGVGAGDGAGTHAHTIQVALIHGQSHSSWSTNSDTQTHTHSGAQAHTNHMKPSDMILRQTVQRTEKRKRTHTQQIHVHIHTHTTQHIYRHTQKTYTYTHARTHSRHLSRRPLPRTPRNSYKYQSSYRKVRYWSTPRGHALHCWG